MAEDALQVMSVLTPRSKVVTVINRSEVVGRPLAALLANDGARVFSVDIDCESELRPSLAPILTSSDR
jgi:methylenetetrahydrofolate dehydrogenase (NAD+)